MRFLTRQFPTFFDVPDAGAGAGAPPSAPSAPAPAPVAPAATPPSGGPASVSGTGGAAPGAGAPPTQFSYAEDRSKWIPPHRLDEVQGRYRQLEGRYRDLDNRIRILMGYDEGARRDPQTEQVRSQFAQVFPELAPLLQNPQALQQVLGLVQSGQLQELTGTTQAYWNRHAQTYARDMVAGYAKAIGVDPSTLSPRAVNRMALQLKAFIEEDPTGERQYRYEMGDPRLMEECLADVNGLFVDPVRRATNTAAARTVENNRRVPDAGPRGPVPAQGGAPAQGRNRKDVREAARQFVLANR